MQAKCQDQHSRQVEELKGVLGHPVGARIPGSHRPPDGKGHDFEICRLKLRRDRATRLHPLRHAGRRDREKCR